ncbi:MAG: hypothetical protein LBT05_06430 [Planctomycetaceae bacterium]|nr:hypothetical protein [Planctomycetaceae bacterium]
MRLWAPVRSDQFGGNARLREGMWGEISYNYMLITKGKNTTIGWVAPGGLQSDYFTGSAFSTRTNNMTTGSLGNNFNSGATLRIGNIRGHHGWEIASTIMQSQKDSYEGVNGSMDISDGTTKKYVSPPNAQSAWFFSGNPQLPFTQTTPGKSMQGNFLWGWYQIAPYQTGGILLLGNEDNEGYAIAPLPLFFDRYKINSKTSHWDIQANYVFRSHATRVGFFEFSGGVRYLELDDKIGFTGWGDMWNSYVENTESSSSGSTDTDNDNNIEVSPYSLKSDTQWNFTADNHIIGPQAGIRWIRKNSGRWSLTADTKFFAGFNTQNVRSRGNFGASTFNVTENNESGSGGTGGTGTGNNNTTIVTGVPLGLLNGAKEFHHRRILTDFSPGIDFSLKASWQFTDAIALQAGYQGMWIDNTARASRVNNYMIDHYGNIFGINDEVTQSTWIHGVNAGIVINR